MTVLSAVKRPSCAPHRPAVAVKAPAAAVLDAPATTLAPDEDALHDAITRALLEGRLRAGTPLRERYLAESFGVTRGMVRKVLLRLGQEGKLEMHANRGAYVPEPTAEQIRHVYQARKAVEAGILALLAPAITPSQLKQLRKHVQQERSASERARRDQSVQLAGDFHVVLAELLGNPELSDTVRRLVSRTQMFVSLFEAAQHSHCAAQEHGPVIEALAKGDATAAVNAMVEHLSSVELRVLGRMAAPQPAPVADILRAVLQGRA